MNTVKDRLIYFLSEKRMSKSEFGRRIGMSRAFVTSMRKSIQPDTLEKIREEFPELNITWLLTGDGDMTVDPAASLVPLATDGIPFVGEGENVVAGSLAGYGEGFKPSDVTEFICMPSLSWREGDFAVRTRGRSMIDKQHPEQNINDGAIVCLRPWKERHIQWGEIYCIATNDGYAVKRLMPGESSDTVRCVSSNEEEGYAPFDVPTSDIKGIAKVTAIINMQLL